MIPKYTIEYSPQFRKHAHTSHYSTDDPVACEEFVEELLQRGYFIRAIRHEGLDLPESEFDRIVKTAAAMLASRHICASLGIKPEEEKYRFGFAA
jgi:7-keto-8-aminopelargonate synthetase-like enzyme